MAPERKRVTPLDRMVATSRRMVAVRRAPSRLARAGRRWHRAGRGRRQAWHRRIVLLHVGGEDGVGAGVGLWRRRRQPSDHSAAMGRISRRRRLSNPFASRGAAWPSTSVSFFAHPLAEGDTPMYGRLGRINPSCDKVRGGAFFAKIRASATGESDLPCIYGTKWPATGTRTRRVRTIAATPWNPLEGFKLTTRHLLPS
jgi:hypothetical protein